MPPKKRAAAARAGGVSKRPALKRPAAALPPAIPSRVPVFVMLPLDWMADDASGLRDPGGIRSQLELLRAAGVRGVMADVWWGLCELDPKKYRFGGALALCGLLRDLGLKLQATMAFHKCGGNVGDAVTVPLPPWALDAARERGLLYRSRGGVVSEDCLSLSADGEVIFPSGEEGEQRTALACYGDFVGAFAAHCSDHLGTTVVELQVGAGPCGELRYPSYMLANGWAYPGVGLVMAHDVGMLRMLVGATGLSEPPAGLPEDQNGKPDDCPMFRASNKESEQFRTGKGKEFLQWYSKVLVDHGEAVLKAAAAALSDKGVAPDCVDLSMKVSGLHWHVMHPSRATEACAGYDCCTESRADAYSAIAEMLSRAAGETGRPLVFNFTCLEMNNRSDGAPETLSAPEDLIAQVRRACVAHGVPLSGENALEFDVATGDWALSQMGKQLRGWSPGRDRMHALTLLRLTEAFVSAESLRELRRFVSST